MLPIEQQVEQRINQRDYQGALGLIAQREHHDLTIRIAPTKRPGVAGGELKTSMLLGKAKSTQAVVQQIKAALSRFGYTGHLEAPDQYDETTLVWEITR